MISLEMNFQNKRDFLKKFNMAATNRKKASELVEIGEENKIQADLIVHRLKVGAKHVLKKIAR